MHPSWHGCISDTSLRRVIQRFRDISKRVDLKISETSARRLIKDVSSEATMIFSETSLSCIWDCSSGPSNYGIVHLRHGYLFIYLRVFIFFSKLNEYRKLFRACFKQEIYLGYLYKRKTFLIKWVACVSPRFSWLNYFKDFNFLMQYSLFRRPSRKTTV